MNFKKDNTVSYCTQWVLIILHKCVSIINLSYCTTWLNATGRNYNENSKYFQSLHEQYITKMSLSNRSNIHILLLENPANNEYSLTMKSKRKNQQ